MSLTLSINGFCGIPSANMTIPQGITLVAGGNRAGKTSVLRALVACLGAETTVPFVKHDGKDALLKKDTFLLVRGKEGSVSLTGSGGTCRVVWPSNTRKGTGPFPSSVSRMSLGLVDWMATPQENRLKILLAAIKEDPSIVMEIVRDDLAVPLSESGIGEALVEWAWQTIQTSGWEAANAAAAKAAADAVISWRSVTQETYGSEKVISYRPAGWDEGLVTETEESLFGAVTDATVALETAIANAAVDASEVARLKKVADQARPDIAALTKTLEDSRTYNAVNITALQAKVQELVTEPTSISSLRVAIAVFDKGIEEKRQEMKAIASGKIVVAGICPGCRAKLTAVHDYGFDHPEHGRYKYAIVKVGKDTSDGQPTGSESEEGKLLATDSLTGLVVSRDSEKKRLDKMLAELETARTNSKQRVDDALKIRQQHVLAAEIALTQGNTLLTEITTATTDHAKLVAKGTGGVSKEVIAQLRVNKANAESRQTAWEIKRDADSHAEAIRQYNAIKDLTAPGGLRKTKMNDAMGEINKRLAALSIIANGGMVSLNDEAEFICDGRPYVTGSVAEQYHCQAVLRILLGSMTSSPILLFDWADVLDSAGRLGLVNMLRDCGITAVIAMTVRRQYAVDVAKMFDATYWLEKGVVTDLSHVPDAQIPDQQLPDPQQDPHYLDFLAQLASHDWTWVMSDDPSSCKKGEARRAALLQICHEYGDLYKQAFNAAEKRVWGNYSVGYVPTFPVAGDSQ